MRGVEINKNKKSIDKSLCDSERVAIWSYIIDLLIIFFFYLFCITTMYIEAFVSFHYFGLLLICVFIYLLVLFIF